MLLHAVSESDNGRMMIRYHTEFKSLWLFKHPRFSRAAKLCRAFKNVMTLAEPGGSGGTSPGRGEFPAPWKQPVPLLAPLACPARRLRTGRCRRAGFASPGRGQAQKESPLQLHLGRAAQSGRPSSALRLPSTSRLGLLRKERQRVRCRL